MYHLPSTAPISTLEALADERRVRAEKSKDPRVQALTNVSFPSEKGNRRIFFDVSVNEEKSPEHWTIEVGTYEVSDNEASRILGVTMQPMNLGTVNFIRRQLSLFQGPTWESVLHEVNGSEPNRFLYEELLKASGDVLEAFGPLAHLVLPSSFHDPQARWENAYVRTGFRPLPYAFGAEMLTEKPPIVLGKKIL